MECLPHHAIGAKVIEIKADNINDAAEEIIRFLMGPNKGDIIYFDGWGGLGASAVLKERLLVLGLKQA
uniref:Uncharacterized protein n=1 Tax=Oryza punctata TaxID=4537 RepID=A0A0E0KNP3_ORYPU